MMEGVGFWRAQVYLGALLTSLGVLAGLLYALLGTPEHANQLLIVAAGGALAAALIMLLPHEAILISPHRSAFFYAWSGFSIGYVALALITDGGASSPLAMQLILPVVFAGQTYRPVAVVVVSLVSGVTYVVIAIVGPSVPAGTVILLTSGLFWCGLISALTARARLRVIGEMHDLHESLRETARRDPLTGCLNHGAFHDAVAVELARTKRSDRPTAALLVDLDDFKSVNDRFGHLAGDELLRRVGDVMRSVLRADDVAGRIGGDEFALLLPELRIDHAQVVAQRLLAALAESGVSASMGVAIAEDGDLDADGLLGRADIALYEAKRGGKCRVSITAELVAGVAVA
jgi:diguanylate cyclase (GGDEF)-like protein